MRFRSIITLGVALGLAAVTALHAYTLAAQQPRRPMPPAPTGATARCRDGTYSFSKHHSGTCSRHGGVAMWLGAETARPPTASDTLGQAPRGASRGGAPPFSVNPLTRGSMALVA